MKLSLSLFGLLFIIPLFSIEANPIPSDCHVRSYYSRCDYSLKTNSLNKNDAPVFVYKSVNLDQYKSVQYILFLHGRGYARQIGARDSMLEHLKLNDFFADQKNANIIFIAPQDIFFHEDSESIGQDYWIGKEGRDWGRFLGLDIPIFANYLNQRLQVDGNLKTVIGISMGAHGALMLGQNYQMNYQNVIALSPIFRPTISEIPVNDNDIFFKKGIKDLEEINFGTKINHGTAIMANRTYITISKTDFGLDRKNFPNGRESWDRLLKMNIDNNEHHIKILSDERGHSIGFWQDQFKASINWL